MPDSDDQCMRNALPALGALLGLIFSLTGALWCTLGTLSPNGDFKVDGSTPAWLSALPSIQYGLFKQLDVVVQGASVSGDTLTVYTKNFCVTYPDGTTRDGKWNAAYGLQITSLVLTGLTTIALLASLCGLPLAGGSMALCGLVLLLAGVLFQGLVFLFYQSSVCSNNPDLAIRTLQQTGVYNTSCGLGPAGILLIVAIVVFFLTALGCCAMAKSSSSGQGEEAADGGQDAAAAANAPTKSGPDAESPEEANE